MSTDCAVGLPWSLCVIGNCCYFLQTREMFCVLDHCRRRALHEQDPVNHLKLGGVLRQKLQESMAAHGQGLQDSLNGLDASVAVQLQKVLTAA